MDGMEVFNTDSLKNIRAHAAIKWMHDIEKDWKSAFGNKGLQRSIPYPKNSLLQNLDKLQAWEWGYVDFIQVSAMDVRMMNHTHKLISSGNISAI